MGTADLLIASTDIELLKRAEKALREVFRFTPLIKGKLVSIRSPETKQNGFFHIGLIPLGENCEPPSTDDDATHSHSVGYVTSDWLERDHG